MGWYRCHTRGYCVLLYTITVLEKWRIGPSLDPQCCTTIIPVTQARGPAHVLKDADLVSTVMGTRMMNQGVVDFSSCWLVKLDKTDKTDKEELKLLV